MTITIVHCSFLFYTTDESFLVVGPVVGKAQDTKGMDVSQAQTEAYKKALTILFNIATEDMTNVQPTPEALSLIWAIPG